MERQYRKYITTLFTVLIFFCIITTGYFLFAIGLIINHNDDILYDMVISTAQEDMKRAVNNVVISIENKRVDVQEEAAHTAEHMAEYIDTAAVLPGTPEELGDYLQVLKYGSVIQVLIEDQGESGQAVLIAEEMAEETVPGDKELQKRIESSPVYQKVEKGDIVCHIFAEQEAIDEIVKKQIHDEIHRTIYGDEKYVWVNEVVNFEGGDDYAIRVIHPNLVETEGIYLSTNMEDMVGNKPYLAELDGIKKDGEILHNYYFKKLNSDEIAEKLSYARLYEPYQWIIATGEPLEDVLKTSKQVSDGSKQIGYTLIAICIVTELVLAIGLIILQKTYRKNIDSYVKTETELDTLTGALSRKAGQAELEKCFSIYQEKGGSYMLLMIDVDKFKEINDTYGHAVGDTVLCQVVQVLLKNTRKCDSLIRWGGDEFLVLCTGVEKEVQPKVAGKLLNSVRALRVDAAQQAISLTLSMGYSSFEPGDQDIRQILKRADEALYHSKAAGRNQFTSYEQMMAEREGKGEKETPEMGDI